MLPFMPPHEAQKPLDDLIDDSQGKYTNWNDFYFCITIAD